MTKIPYTDLTPISERLAAAAKWVSKDMQPDRWYSVNADQVEVLKQLVKESYGFDVFSISFNNEMNKIKKTMI